MLLILKFLVVVVVVVVCKPILVFSFGPKLNNFNLKPNLELNPKLNLEPSMKLSGCLDMSLQIAVGRLQFAVYLSQLKMLFLILGM